MLIIEQPQQLELVGWMVGVCRQRFRDIPKQPFVRFLIKRKAFICSGRHPGYGYHGWVAQ